MQTIAEIKAAVTKLERTIIYLETRSFAVLLTEEQQAELETAKKELDILEKKERLEELRKELQDGQLSYGELAELQSLSEYIEKGDVELLEAAGVPEFPEDETADLFETPELIPENVRAVFDKYDNGDELSYEEIFKLHTEVEQLGYTFEYYLDAVPYDLRKIKTN